MMKKISLIIIGIFLGVSIAVWVQGFFAHDARRTTHDEKIIRVGHLGNITHLQALVGRHRGDFERAFETDAKIEWHVFHGGPSVMTALLAGELDIAYVGPGPAINVYLRSQGEAIRVIAGATSGGSGLVVRGDEALTKPEDFHGKRIATPQIGNTQDIACRYWLKKNGLRSREKGGDVLIIPLIGSDQLMMIRKKEIDAVWAVEPWISRLINEGGARLLIDERDLWPGGKYLTNVLLARKDYLAQRPDRVKKWLQVHVELTDWIRAHPEEAAQFANEEFEKITGKKLSEEVLKGATSRMEATSDPMEGTLVEQARRAYEIGFLGKEPPRLEGIVDSTLLEEVSLSSPRKRESSGFVKDPGLPLSRE